jgi:hypothetical protein
MYDPFDLRHNEDFSAEQVKTLEEVFKQVQMS